MRRLIPYSVALALLGATGPAQAHEVAITHSVRAIHGRNVVVAAHGDQLPVAADRHVAQRARMAALVATPRRDAAAAILPSTWCGVERADDDTADAAVTGAQIKVVYAYPSDQPDHFSLYRDSIQTDVGAIRDLVLASAHGTKTLRFDMGTNCGPQYVDVASIRLPHPRSYYMTGGVSQRAHLLEQDLGSAPSAATGVRDFAVYADTLYGGDGVAGLGGEYLDDSPGPGNASNHGGLYALVFGDGSAAFQHPRTSALLHEISHTLGAVQDSAPHASGNGHCWDEWDVMCYSDGGSRIPATGLTYNCADSSHEQYDCGQDDYFNPAPAAGSYLATHWNLYDSAFLCPVAECGGSGSASTPPPTPTPTPPPSGSGGGTASTGSVPGLPNLDALLARMHSALTSLATRVRRTGLAGLAAGRSIRAAFTAPSDGRVTLALRWRGRTIAQAHGHLSPGQTGVATLKADGRARAALVRARSARLVVRAAFTPTGRATVTREATLTLRRGVVPLS